MRKRSFSESQAYWDGYRVGYVDGKKMEAWERQARNRRRLFYYGFLTVGTAVLLLMFLAVDYL